MGPEVIQKCEDSICCCDFEDAQRNGVAFKGIGSFHGIPRKMNSDLQSEET